jgi:endonuclease/exonuclease/phosphatase family metal-dependent hydrolase
MRFLLYNIRYGTGRRERNAWMDMLRRTDRHFEAIAYFIRELEPDVVGLVETDSGSFRNRSRSQPQRLAEMIGHYHAFEVKYRRRGLMRHTPVLSKQGNAFLTCVPPKRHTFHFFEQGFKRLVIELELERVRLFLVHLSLRRYVRREQLHHLETLIRQSDKPCIVAGDFNALLGPKELAPFLRKTGMKRANPENRPTYPSWNPTRVLDFVCYTPCIRLKGFALPQVTLSDHLPLICDFELPEQATQGTP